MVRMGQIDAQACPSKEHFTHWTQSMFRSSPLPMLNGRAINSKNLVPALLEFWCMHMDRTIKQHKEIKLALKMRTTRFYTSKKWSVPIGSARKRTPALLKARHPKRPSNGGLVYAREGLAKDADLFKPCGTVVSRNKSRK